MAAEHQQHEVEPIPWLGKVGEVEPLDRTRLAVTPPTTPSPSASRLEVKSPSKASAAMTQGAASVAVAVPGKAPTKPKKIDPKRSGSGIPARKVIRGLVWARRIVQVSSLALFTFLLVETTFRGSFAARAEQVVRMPYPVEGFLLADPFVRR